MSNKTFFIILPISIIFSLCMNHQIYGNSNRTVSNIERLGNINHSMAKRRHARSMAKYMYKRIKYYQGLEDWWIREQAVNIFYEGLKKEGL